MLTVGEALRSVCFHAQQATEKSLKAFLAVDDVVYPWTHDLGALLTLLKERFPVLCEMEASIGGLTDYAVNPRYGIGAVPDMAKARSALDTAQKVYALAEQIIAEREAEAE